MRLEWSLTRAKLIGFGLGQQFGFIFLISILSHLPILDKER